MINTILTNAADYPLPLAIGAGLMLACLLSLVAFDLAEANRPRRRRAQRARRNR